MRPRRVLGGGRCRPLLASLLTLSDVYGTGYHAALKGGVTGGSTVTVIGDGAVGLLAVLSARQLGAERIILMIERDRPLSGGALRPAVGPLVGLLGVTAVIRRRRG